MRRVVPHWTRPKLVAEVAFAGWTGNGSVRQAVFHGLRDDKPPRQIVRETPRQASKAVAGSGAGKSKVTSRRAPPEKTAGLTITHPDRVIDKASGITKGELVAYYAAVPDRVEDFLGGFFLFFE